jgi:hypothetical protein
MFALVAEVMLWHSHPLAFCFPGTALVIGEAA